MISKELIREILEIHPLIEIMNIELIGNKICWINSEIPQSVYDETRYINIYELADKCKRWAISNDICISSGNCLLKADGFYCLIDGFIPIEEKIFYADTEIEAIFDACKWILDSKDK